MIPSLDEHERKLKGVRQEVRNLQVMQMRPASQRRGWSFWRTWSAQRGRKQTFGWRSRTQRPKIRIGTLKICRDAGLHEKVGRDLPFPKTGSVVTAAKGHRCAGFRQE